MLQIETETNLRNKDGMVALGIHLKEECMVNQKFKPEVGPDPKYRSRLQQNSAFKNL